MVTSKRNTFLTGFLTAALLWLAWWIFVNLRFEGGHVEDSPSAKYTLMIFAPMMETVGGTYTITLKDKPTGNVLRLVTVKLNSDEQTKLLRGNPVSLNWDASESYSDITIDGEFLIRLSVPTLRP